MISKAYLKNGGLRKRKAIVKTQDSKCKNQDIMEAMLMEVLNDGEKIVLLDGSEWYINPGDMPTVCTWIPTAELRIVKTKSNDYFKYRITNEGIDTSVYAARLK